LAAPGTPGGFAERRADGKSARAQEGPRPANGPIGPRKGVALMLKRLHWIILLMIALAAFVARSKIVPFELLGNR